jgi:PAS domain S-box-containing protein
MNFPAFSWQTGAMSDHKTITEKTTDLSIERYHSLVEASLDPLFTVDPWGKIMDFNKALIEITGKPAKELEGQPFFHLFLDPEKTIQLFDKILVNGAVVNHPLNIRHRNGNVQEVLFNGSVLSLGKDRTPGATIVIRDVTEQKRFERELIEAKSNAEKEKQVAEEAMKAKQQFLSNMSHEIRTPLNAIIGFTKVVLKTELTEKQKEYLTAIKISGDALIVLINDILDLAKVDAGKMTFEQIPFKLSDSINSMLHLFETKLFKKKIGLVKEYDHSIPEVVVGDPVRLHQIILNLVGNAVKFTSEGKVTVSVKLIEEREDSVKIDFSVKDTGIGIPENELDSIFDNFQQASAGTSRIYGGTGLGLAIVKQLVQSQGGKVSVKSKVGQGSTFGFTLEFKKTKEQLKKEPEPSPHMDMNVGNGRILIVEDVTLNQLLLKTLLREFGYEYDVASNGKIAIDLFQKKKYDLILMDLQMPEMNGYETTEFIRSNLRSEIPIIALTADVTTADVEKCRSIGMNDYLAKPIDDKLLYVKIRKFLEGQSAHHPFHEKKAETIHHTQRCVNLDYLRQHTRGNSQMIREMIKIYLEETPKLISTMKESINNMDWDTLGEAAHSIIPTFSIMGIHKEYEEMAKKIKDHASRKEQSASINKLFVKLEDVCGQAIRELETELDAL